MIVSEIKEKLLEAVENLFNALKETQKAKDFNGMKCNLNKIRIYCYRAEKLLIQSRKNRYRPTKMLKIGHILDEEIRSILREIEEKKVFP